MAGQGFIPAEEIEQVLQATDIVSLIGGYVQLKPSGKNFMGLCPFHQERTPSFVVSSQRQNYHCYGCGVHGNSISFLRDLEHLQFVDAVKMLADRAGIVVTAKGGHFQKSISGELTQCLDASFNFFRNNLKDSQQNAMVTGYLKDREIHEELIEKFKLGFVGQGWTNLHNYLTKNSFPTKVQESCGLIKSGEKGGYYDRLRERLIFPIRDITGRVIGFAGRILGGEGAKYLNPPETDLYKKSSTFYGIYEAKDTIRRNQRAILVEGYLDVLRLHEKGWTEAIAACGTAFNLDHLNALKRIGPKEVVLLFDGDKAGQAAAEKTAKLCIQHGLDSLVLILPEGLDPDDFFKKYSTAQFSILLEQAPKDYDFLIQKTKDVIKDQGLTSGGKNIEELINLAAQVKSDINRGKLEELLSENFNLDKKKLSESLQAKQKESLKKITGKVHTGSLIRLPKFNKQDDPELNLLSYLIAQPKAITLVKKWIQDSDFFHPVLSGLFQRLSKLPEEEFMLLGQDDFPDIFVEYKDLIMNLNQNSRESVTGSFSLETLQSIIFTIKKRAKAHLVQKQRDALIEAQKEIQIEINQINESLKELNPRPQSAQHSNKKG